MHYFAQIDENNIVLQVIVAEQSFINTLENPASWIETFIDNSQRGLYAGIGYSYDPINDEFIAPPDLE